MKLCAYLRVSTEAQADRYGLDVQRQTVRDWAKANGHTIVRGGWFTDEGVSGTLADRDGLGEALACIASRRAAGLVVPRLDRLARDLVVQEQLLAEVTRAGGQVLSCSDAEASYLGDDPDDPSRKLIRQVLGAVSAYERDMVVLRLRSGRRRKAERGGYAYGAPAYGARAEAGELVDDAREQAAIRRAVELHQQGHSLRTIAAELTNDGHAPKRGQQWHPQTVARLIRRHSAVLEHA